jgi:hypothetical protein
MIVASKAVGSASCLGLTVYRNQFLLFRLPISMAPRPSNPLPRECTGRRRVRTARLQSRFHTQARHAFGYRVW